MFEKALWSKSVTVYTQRTEARLQNIHFTIYCHVEYQHFPFEVFFAT